MDAVLIRPPETNRIYAGIPEFFNSGIFLFPPLGLMQIKSYAERLLSCEVAVYDSLLHGAGYAETAEYVSRVSPRVAGICAFTHSLVDVMETAAHIKRAAPSVHVTVGGPHTYTFHEEAACLLQSGDIDSVVLGDGEEAFAGIVSAAQKGEEPSAVKGIIYKDKAGAIVRSGGPSFADDLDSLPFPARDIPGAGRYYTPASSGQRMTTVISSRGCPHDCTFCDVQKKYRSRSAASIVDELAQCRRLGFKEAFFVDDTFNVNAERVIRISEEILKQGVKMRWGFKGRCDGISRDMLAIARRAGCFRIHYGVETAAAEGLSSINKRITTDAVRAAFAETKKSGIRTTAYFIIGFPHEKKASDIRETLDFAAGLAADFAVFSLLSPYPDTALYREGVRRGVLDPGPWRAFIRSPRKGIDVPTCWEEHFSRRELSHFLKAAHRSFYYRPRIILNALRGAHTLTELARIMAGARSLLTMELNGRRNHGS